MASSDVARTTMPGVQNPHWTAPAATNARWMTCGCIGVPMPSMVRTDFPATRLTGKRHDITTRPSMSTAQAPQSARSQPFFAPVSPRSSRSTSKRLRSGSVVMVRSSPFRVKVIVCIGGRPSGRARLSYPSPVP